MFDKKFYFKIFFIGFLLVLFQSFFQNYTSLMEIFKSGISATLPFIYAIFIAILLNPIVNLLGRSLKINRTLSILLSVSLVALFIIGVFLIIVPNLIMSTNDLISRFPQMLVSLNTNAAHIIEFLREKNLLFFDPAEIENNLIGLFKSNLGNLRNLILTLGLDIFQGVLGVLNFFLGIFLALFLIQDKEYYLSFLKNFFVLFTTKEKATEIVIFLDKTQEIFLKYIFGRVITSAAVGITAFIVMLIANVPYALISALLIGLGNMIPYVGSIVAGIIAVFLIVLAAPAKIIYLFLAIAIGQSVDGFILGPKILSQTVGMSSFWTIVAVLVCGNIMGPIGLFLGVPIFGIIKLIYIKKLNEKFN